MKFSYTLQVFLALVAWSSAGVCAETSPVPANDLMSVLRMTLANQAEIELAKLDIVSARGKVQSAGGSFDSELFSKAYYEKEDGLLTEYEKALLGYDAERSESVGVEVGVRRVFRNGYLAQTAVRSVRVDNQSGLEGYPTITRNVLEFSLKIPLLRGGGIAVTADERRLELVRQAVEKRYQQTVSDALASAAASYWDYLAAFKNLKIKEETEQRTASFLKNTNRLIELGERPSADSTQISAQLASKRSERIEAERQLYEAKQTLGIALGLSLEQLELFGDPEDVFPTLSNSECLSHSDIKTFYAEARGNRGDYQAAYLETKALEVAVEKSRDSLKPRLDLKLAASLEGISEDRALADPAIEDETGPGGLIVLNGEWPFSNNSARGDMASLQAQKRQAQLRLDELERKIRSNISVAAMDICRNLKASASIREAVDLYEIAVANEINKLKLGLSTLTNTISVEDKRNLAQEDLIVQQSALAKAIVRLRNETGSLLQMADGRGGVEKKNIITLPRVETREPDKKAEAPNDS